jgi:hypothetical protein
MIPDIRDKVHAQLSFGFRALRSKPSKFVKMLFGFCSSGAMDLRRDYPAPGSSQFPVAAVVSVISTGREPSGGMAADSLFSTPALRRLYRSRAPAIKHGSATALLEPPFTIHLSFAVRLC